MNTTLPHLPRAALRVLAAIACIVAVALGGCSRSDPGDSGAPAAVIVGSADFAESQLMAVIYSHALQAAGVPTEERLNIGSREVYAQALADGSIDLVPEYDGTLLAFLEPGASAEGRDEIQRALDASLPDGVIALRAADAQNRDGLVVPRALASEHHLASIDDLAPISESLTLAGSAEWRSRFLDDDGALRRYGIRFGRVRVFDAGGPLTLAALVNGQAQIGDMFSSDPAIRDNDLVVLDDPRGLFGEARLLPIIREDAASSAVRRTLEAISGALSQDELVAMNGRIGAGEDIGRIADDWLAEHSLD